MSSVPARTVRLVGDNCDRTAVDARVRGDDVRRVVVADLEQRAVVDRHRPAPRARRRSAVGRSGTTAGPATHLRSGGSVAGSTMGSGRVVVGQVRPAARRGPPSPLPRLRPPRPPTRRLAWTAGAAQIVGRESQSGDRRHRVGAVDVGTSPVRQARHGRPGRAAVRGRRGTGRSRRARSARRRRGRPPVWPLVPMPRAHSVPPASGRHGDRVHDADDGAADLASHGQGPLDDLGLGGTSSARPSWSPAERSHRPGTRPPSGPRVRPARRLATPAGRPPAR